jgi:hypothetical protein
MTPPLYSYRNCEAAPHRAARYSASKTQHGDFYEGNKRVDIGEDDN